MNLKNLTIFILINIKIIIQVFGTCIDNNCLTCSTSSVKCDECKTNYFLD